MVLQAVDRYKLRRLWLSWQLFPSSVTWTGFFAHKDIQEIEASG